MLRMFFLLGFLLVQVPVLLQADDQQTIVAIRKVGGTVRAAENGWEVDFHLRGRSLTDDQLARVAGLSAVSSLNLKRTRISSAGLAHLEAMKSLQVLHLEQTAIDDQGMQYLAGLKNLEYLNLFGTKITDQGLTHVSGLSKLQRLYVWQTAVTDDGVVKLEKALPGLRVVRGVNLAKIAAEFPLEEPAALPTKTIGFVATTNVADAPRSRNGDNIEVVFQNKSRRAVKVVWVGYDGKLKVYGEIAAGGMRVQNSYSNNCWLITDMADEPIGYFICGAERALAIIAE